MAHTDSLLCCEACELSATEYVRAGHDRPTALKFAELEHYSIPHGGEWPSYEAMQSYDPFYGDTHE